MRSLQFLVILAVTGALLSGCMPPSSTAPEPFQKKFSRLEREHETLDKKLTRLQDSLILLEGRLEDQQRTIDKLRTAPASRKVTPSGEKAEPAGEEPAEKPLGSAPPPTEIYLKAFSDYTAGRYAEAARGFAKFLNHYPNNEYAGNARYWLGECFYAQQDYSQAVETFQTLVQENPTNAKTPAAMLKLASAYLELEQPEQARETVRALQERYPDSDAARRVRTGQDNPFGEDLPDRGM